MRKIKLSTRLTWIVVLLSTVITTLAGVGIGAIVFFETEHQIKNKLVSSANLIVTEYLNVRDGSIELQDRSSDDSLVSYLRGNEIAMYIEDKDFRPLVKYGMYRDLSTEEIEKILVGDRESLANKRGIYRDVELSRYGRFDTYSIALYTDSQIVGYMQIARINDVMPILLRAIVMSMMVLLPIVWIVSVFVAYRSSELALSPLKHLVMYLEQVDVENLPKRIEIPDYLDNDTRVLTSAFNSMMERVRSVLARQREISENISHEFKTPLTRVASGLEVIALKTSKSVSSKIEGLVQEILGLGRNVDALLALAINSQSKESVRVIKLKAKVNELVKRLDSKVPVTVEIQDDAELVIYEGYLELILRNLLENAAKYTLIPGYIRVRYEELEQRFKIVIENPAPHTLQDKERVFERRYQEYGYGEKGYGLGLAIVRDVARQCDLKIIMRNIKPNIVRVEISGKRPYASSS
ncbi:MAG: heavy metal sensor signal transduction histidine kinase [Microgenomates group bacterium GW2011_GWF2_47_9]|nr:MAG: heavy metal sensor signal transduction histidine kinase [Microgenomates group bacterium GW2011_GWF2_47_9]